MIQQHQCLLTHSLSLSLSLSLSECDYIACVDQEQNCLSDIGVLLPMANDSTTISRCTSRVLYGAPPVSQIQRAHHPVSRGCAHCRVGGDTGNVQSATASTRRGIATRCLLPICPSNSRGTLTTTDRRITGTERKLEPASGTIKSPWNFIATAKKASLVCATENRH
jgi:hypothetical protein